MAQVDLAVAQSDGLFTVDGRIKVAIEVRVAGAPRSGASGAPQRRTTDRAAPPGVRRGTFVGSAESNWSTYTGGRRAVSDRNRIIGNRIRRTGGESIDSHG